MNPDLIWEQALLEAACLQRERLERLARSLQQDGEWAEALRRQSAAERPSR